MENRVMSPRETEEAQARCVAIAVFYHNSRRSAQRSKIVADDIREVAEWLVQTGLGVNEVRDRILCPLKGELSSRYGDETTDKLSVFFDRVLRRQLAVLKAGQRRPQHNH